VLTCGVCWDEHHAESCGECFDDEPDDVTSEAEQSTCDCDGPLHSVHCWWVVNHDDGRPQATGDPAIDLAESEAQALARTPWPKRPGMSRADFAYLARILAELHFISDEGLPHGGPGTTLRYVAEHFAHHLADTNARFDRERFVQAATGSEQ
jgi:hypothetical protein